MFKSWVSGEFSGQSSFLVYLGGGNHRFFGDRSYLFDSNLLLLGGVQISYLQGKIKNCLCMNEQVINDNEKVNLCKSLGNLFSCTSMVGGVSFTPDPLVVL